MNKNIYCIIFIVILSITTYASNYNLSITYNLKTSIDPINDSLGNIVINKYITNRQTFDITKINNTYNSMSMQINDFLRLNSSNSIMIDNRLLTPNNVIDMPNAGSFTFYEVATPNITQGVVIVYNISNPVINFSTHSNNLIPLEFSENNVPINVEKIIYVTAKAPLTLLPETYYPTLFILQEGNNTYQQSLNLKMKRYIDWNISSMTYDTTVATGTHNKLGTMIIKNIGNTYTTLRIVRTGDLENLVLLPEEVLVYPNIDNKINIMYDIQEGTAIGNNKTMYIKIFGEGREINTNITVDIKDNINPEFRDFDVKDVKINRDTEFMCTFWDNHEVTNITATLINRNIDQRIPVTFTKEPDGKYRARFKILSVGLHELNVCLYDASGNFNCTTKSFNVGQIDTIHSTDNIKFYRVRVNEYCAQDDLFTVSEEEEIQIYVNKMSYNGTWSLKIIDGNGKEFFLDAEGQKINLKTNGTVKISFRGSALGEYNGELRLIPPDYHVNLPLVTLSGEIANYTVPKSFSMEWYGNKISCKPYDSGNPDTSYQQCDLKIPLTSDFDTAAIPLTMEQKQKVEQANLIELNSWKDKNFNKIIAIVVLSILLTTIVIFTWYMTWVYPITRFKWK